MYNKEEADKTHERIEVFINWPEEHEMDQSSSKNIVNPHIFLTVNSPGPS